MFKSFTQLALVAGLAFFFVSCNERPSKANRFYAKTPVSSPWKAPESSLVEKPSIDKLKESEVLNQINKVAVLPFVNLSGGSRNTLEMSDMIMMAEQFSNHLVGGHTFKTIVFPREAINALAESNLSTMKMDDLKEIGNELGVDAIVFGIIKQYDMYYPPKLTISMKFYLTSLGRFAQSHEISNMAHSGVPLLTYNPTFFKQLWDTSCHYDGSNRRFKEIVKHFLKTHDPKFSGFIDERYKRSKRDFLNILAYDLANSLNSKKEEDKHGVKGHTSSKGRGRVQRHQAPDGYFNK